MATFVIEMYLSRARAAELDNAIARLHIAIAAMPAGPDQPRRPRIVRSYYVADDEIAYYIVDASSLDVVAELSRSAGLVPDRIVEAAVG